MIPELPIPGHPDYTINTQGKVFHNGEPKALMFKPGRAPKLRIQVNGKAWEWGVATLVARLFLPNPDNAPKVIFKDGNQHNLDISNIQWVSGREYVRHNLHPGLSMEIKPPPTRPPVFIDPQRVPVDDAPGYFISPSGLLYRGNKLLKVHLRRGRAPIVRLCCGDAAGGYRYPGLATLLASHFIPNPRKHRYIIFKDRNHHNCTLDNIAWVDGPTYIHYCMKHMGSRKIQGNREDAISRCTEEHLLMYYKTGDESWLHHYWEQLEKRVRRRDWDEYRAECYLYFIDRARRFSLYRDPIGLMMLHCRKLRSQAFRTMRDHIPVRKLLQTDESLR
jgi:hypothetical protein